MDIFRSGKETGTVRSEHFRYQRTLAQPAEIAGVGFLTGARLRVRFVPAPVSTGIVFVRGDLGPGAMVPARVEYVTGTQRRTTLGSPPIVVSLVEHVLAALAGLRIDNCFVEVNGPEPPGLDGSAQGFVDVLRRAGLRLQPARRDIWAVTATVLVAHQGATLAIHPAAEPALKISYFLDYGPFAPIDRQVHTQQLTPESFANEIAGCRTFLLESEAQELKRQGLGVNTQVSDLLVFGPHGPIDNTLRFANEPARHKILDLVGDLSLLGHDIYGHVVAYRSGHPLNVELVRKLVQRLPAAVGESHEAARLRA
jgi:UDP-3-O-acyl N-acetylglucosamine deacetylase